MYRVFDKDGKATADLICVHDETIDTSKPLELFDPDFTWKRKQISGFTVKELQVPVFKNGKRVYDSPDIKEIKAYCAEQIGTLWDSLLRFENPHKYHVDLSQKLWDIKQKLLSEREG